MKLKTRTNQPVYYKLPVSSNIEQLSDGLLNSLKVGDVVQKKTGNQKHCYIVTYKEEKHGICLSYFNAGYSETISYDYTNGHWVFNSKDVSNIEDIPNVEEAPSGTIVDALGLDAQGKIVKGVISGGTQLYKHSITYKNYPKVYIIKRTVADMSNPTVVESAETWEPYYGSKTMEIISNVSTPLSTFSELNGNLSFVTKLAISTSFYYNVRHLGDSRFMVMVSEGGDTNYSDSVWVLSISGAGGMSGIDSDVVTKL